MEKNTKVAILCTALFAAHPVDAQTFPDAGALQQQIERERQLQLPRQVAPERPATPPQMKPDGVSVTVREFRFAGNTLLSTERLAPLVASYLNRPLSFAELQAAAAAIANAYLEAGWVVRAYLPQQDIQEGIVTIQIVEAVFGKLITTEEPQRLKLSTVLSRFEARQAPGEVVNTEALDRALLLADDLPGVNVAGALQAGTHEGETDLALKLRDEPLMIGEASVDNSGSRSTGENRLNANATLASPLGLGDQLSAHAIHSQGSDYMRVGYSLPVGADGWRVGTNASRLDYELVTAEFRPLHAEGHSTSVGLEASYPVIRSRMRNLYLNLAYDQKRFENRANFATTSDYDIDVFGLALFGNLFDGLGSGGANSASVNLSRGRVDLGGSPNQAADAATTATQGDFTKLRYSLARQQVITPELSLFAAYAGQWANKNLDSAEKFYLGGANGVRAYPTNEGGGSAAQLVNLELRWKLPQALTTTAFYDWGEVTQNVDNAVAATYPNRYSLKGYGLSLAWQTRFGINLKATWARRDGNNPNPTTRGKDQDGSLVRDRWWLSASLPF